MKITNADQIKFRASSMGKIMTGTKSGAPVDKSVTCWKELIKVYARLVHGREEDISSKYFEKGHKREEGALTLLTEHQKRLFVKNTERLEDEYFSGEYDAHIKDKEKIIIETVDTKCPFSLFTYLEQTNESLDDAYKYQGLVYNRLTGATKHTVAFCLMNGTEEQIAYEKKKAGYPVGMISIDGNESPEYIEKCKQIEINHIFDLDNFKREFPYYQFHNTEWSYDIPKSDRVFTISFDRNEFEIQKMISRVKECRLWMNRNLFKI